MKKWGRGKEENTGKQEYKERIIREKGIIKSEKITEKYEKGNWGKYIHRKTWKKRRKENKGKIKRKKTGKDEKSKEIEKNKYTDEENMKKKKEKYKTRENRKRSENKGK